MAIQEAKTNNFKTLLSNSNFRMLWIGQTISQIGDGLTNLALLIVINRLTGSTAALATLMVAIALPQVFFGLISGVYVDRWNRKQIMIVSDLIRGLIVLGFILVRRPEQVWIFYLLGFLQAMVGTFFDPAKSAMIPTIVEADQLLAANSLSQTTRVITGVIGSALAGILVGLTGSAWPAFTLDGVTFIASALLITKIHPPEIKALAGGNLRQTLFDLKEGLQYLFGHKSLVAVMITFAITMLGLGAVNVLVVPFLLNNLSVKTETLGFIDAAQVIGMVIGGGLVAFLASRLKINQMIAGAVILLGFSVAIFGASPMIWIALVSLFFVGFFLTPAQASAATLFQLNVTDEKRGRTSSAMNTVISLASIISMSLAGILGAYLGIREVFYLAGGITIFSGVLAYFLLRSPESTQAPQEIPEIAGVIE
jgi:MFS transporter, DHA3 family, macrolide efflux protein